MFHYLAQVNTKLKMFFLLFLLGVVPVGVIFVLLNTYEPSRVVSYVGLLPGGARYRPVSGRSTFQRHDDPKKRSGNQ